MATLPTFEIPNEMRASAETSVDQARRAIDGVIALSRRNAELMQGSAEAARIGARDLYARGFERAEQNIHAGLDFAHKLVRANDLQEALQIQAEFVRERFGALQAQAREFGEIAQGALRQGAEHAQAAAKEGAKQARQLTQLGQDATQRGADAARDAVGSGAH